MKRYKSWMLAGLITLSVCLFGMKMQKVQAEDIQFSVEAILPENQRDTGHTYFDLRVSPGQQQDLELELVNKTDEQMNLVVKINPATTNKNGVIDYNTKAHLDPTLQYPLTQLVSTDSKKVKLEGGERKKISLHLSVPEIPFSGQILGGVYVSVVPRNEKDRKKTKIINKQSIVKGIMLSESDEEIEPKFDLLNVSANQIGYRNVFLAKIQNPVPLLIEDLSLTAKVYASGSSKAIFEEQKNGVKMAPNSYFDYPIFLEEKPFEAGNYRLDLNLQYQGRKWHFEKKFKVSKLEAQKYNDQIKQNKNKNNIWPVVGGVVIFIIVVLGVALFMLKKRKTSGKDTTVKKKVNSK